MAQLPQRPSRSSRADSDRSAPKTTRPEAASRRPSGDSRPFGVKGGRRLDAMPDRIDIRDWPYQPHLRPLPDQVVNCATWCR